MSPPPPFPDFDFNYDPNTFPNPPPLPASADLFSAAETTDIFGFLDNFNDFGWESEQSQQQQPPPQQQQSYASPRAPYSNPHLNTAPEPSTSGRPRRSTRSSASLPSPQKHQPPRQQKQQQLKEHHQQQQVPRPSPRRDSQTPSNASETSSQSHANDASSSTSAASAPPTATASTDPSRGAGNIKPLLSTPQKRLNHIMSEQKRRNAIRDGYAQLIALLAPDGNSSLGMPQRGRPKGSGSRGKGQSKGKSGVLFRAVEYIRWLEEGRDALREEVLRVEAVAGIR
ncbi:hypothetical protein R3P38DRAFT_2953201 [Favolaschia claudopus]|uniref:BHLH domain-containing protein n=1 Tax=Favolaschia claudopus TaxID=2862362 RepID=A0AAW0BGN9_9AGAR